MACQRLRTSRRRQRSTIGRTCAGSGVELRLVLHHAGQRFRRRFAGEELLTGEHLAEHDAEGPDVGAPVAGFPLACSGLMYGAVPMMNPACVIAGVVMVGDIERLRTVRPARRIHRFGQPEVQDLHRAVGSQLDVRRLQVAMDDSLLVRRFEGFSNLSRDGKGLVDAESHHARFDRPASAPSTSSITSAVTAARPSSEAVDGAMFGWFSDGERLGFALEPCEPLGIVRERLGQDLDRDFRPRLVSVAA